MAFLCFTKFSYNPPSLPPWSMALRSTVDLVLLNTATLPSHTGGYRYSHILSAISWSVFFLFISFYTTIYFNHHISEPLSSFFLSSLQSFLPFIFFFSPIK